MDTASNSQQNYQQLLYDPTVEQIEVLLAGLSAGVVATAVPHGSDVMATLRSTLADPELRFLHILGHGAPGEVFLGGERIDAHRWRHEAATPTPRINPIQINFWSCRTGEGEPGMSFINTVAHTSQAFVNAATGYVGHESKGGSWELDVSAKAVVPFSLNSLNSFTDVLNEAPTNISLTNATVAENAAAGVVVATLSATDADAADTATFALTTGNGSNDADNAKVEIVGNEIKVKSGAVIDYETQQSLKVNVEVTDADGLTYVKALSIPVTDVNEAPTNISLTNATVAENAAAGVVVATLSATDADAADTATFALTTGNGSNDADNAKVEIVGNEIKVKSGAVIDYETQQSLKVNVEVTDADGLTYVKALSIPVTDVNEAPTNISLTNATVAENAAAGVVVATLSATDADAADTATFALTTGNGSNDADNAKVEIVGNEIKVKSGAVIDYETQQSLKVNVEVTDADGLTYVKALSIPVTDVNEAPTNISLTNATVAENAAAGVVVATLSATDADAADTATFALTTGNGSNDADNAKVEIVGNEIKVKSGAVIDYETQQSLKVNVEVTDADGLTYVKALSIPVTDVNEAPTNISLTNATVAENAAAGVVVATLSATDADAADTATFALTTGNGSNDADNAKVEIVGNEIKVKSGAVIDYETQQSLKVNVEVTDADGLTYVKALSIPVTDVNEAPTNISLTNATVAENAAAGVVVATLSATDADAADTATFALTTGNGSNDADNAKVEIVGNEIKVKSGAVIDYETQQSLKVNVEVTDADGLTYVKALSIPVTDVNEAPTNISLTNATVAENAAAGVVVATLSATDADAADTATFALTTGNGSNDADNAKVEIVGNEIKVKSGAVIDYETQQSLKVNVEVTDADGLTYVKALSIPVTDVNEAPTLTGVEAALTQGEEDTSYSISVAQLLQGHSDADGDPLFVVNLSATHATVTPVTTGDPAVITGYTITPDANYNGEVKLSYGVSDGALTTNTSRTFNLSPVADNPVTTNDSITFNEDASRVLALTDFGTYTDADSDALVAIKLTVLPATGKLELYNAVTKVWGQLTTYPTEIAATDIGAGKLRFVPEADTFSTSPSLYTSINFQAKDATGAYSETKNLDVNVLAVPDTVVGNVSTDNLVNIAEAGGVITISGVKDTGDTVEIKLGSATFTNTSAAATWSVNLPANSLQPGANAFTVTSTNTTTTNTTTGNFTLTFDNARPVVTDTGVVVTVDGSGAANIGDVVTMRFTTADTDIHSVSADFSQFGAQQSVLATPLGNGVYQATYTIAANGTVTGSAKVGVAVTDVAGNVSSIVDSTTFAVDDIVPTVNIYRTTPTFNADGTVASVSSTEPNAATNADAVYFKAVFSELVSGVGPSNFTTGQGQIQQVIQLPPSASNQSVFLVKVGGIENFDGDVGISVSNTSNSIVDLAGNPFFAIAENHQYSLDNTPPSTVNVFNAQLVSTSATAATVNINKLAGAEPGVGIKVYEGNTLLATTTANAMGDIAVEVSLTQSATPHVLQIKTVDAVGNESVLGAPRKFYVATVDDLAPLNGGVLTNPKSIQYGDSIVLTSEASISELSFLDGLLNQNRPANSAPGYLSFNKIADSISNLMEGATGTYVVKATASPFINAPYVVGGMTVEVLGDGNVGQLTALKLALASHTVGSDLVNQGRLVVDQVSGTAAELLSTNGQALITAGVDVRVTEPATVLQISDLKGDVSGGGAVQYAAITDTLANIKASLSSGIVQDGVSLNVSLDPSAMAAQPASISIADWKLLKGYISNGTPPDGALNANVSDTAANIKAELFAQDGTAIPNNFFNGLTAGKVVVQGAADVGLLQALKNTMGGANDYGRIEYSAVADTFASLTSFTFDDPFTPQTEQISYLAGKVVTVTDMVSVSQATSPNFNSATKINYTSISGDVGAFVTHATNADGLTTYTATSFVQAGTKVVINQSASIAELNAIKAVTSVEYSAITDSVANLFNNGAVNSLVGSGTHVSVLGSPTVSQLTKLDAATTGTLTYSSVSDTESNLFTGNPLSLSAYVKPGTNVNIEGAVSVDLIDDLTNAVTAVNVGGSTGVINFTAVHGALSDFLNADNTAKPGLVGLNGKTIHVDGSLNKAQYDALQSLNGPGDSATSVTANALDIQQPTLMSIAPANNAGPDTNLQTLTYEVKFNESVKGVTTSNFSITAPSGNQGQPVWSITDAQPVSAVNGLSSKWVVTVAHQAGDTSFTQGEVKVLLHNGAGIQDSLGNSIDMVAVGSSLNGYQVDYQAPLVTDASINVSVSGSGAANVGDTVTVTFAAAEPSAGIQSVSVNFAEFGAKAPVTANYNGTSYVASYELAPNGTVKGSAKASVTVTDKAGNATTFVDGTGFAVDDIVPVATTTRVNPVMDNGQLVGLTPADQETMADALYFKVHFSEAMTGIGLEHFEVVGETTATVQWVNQLATKGDYLVKVAGGDLASLTDEVVSIGFTSITPTDLAGNLLNKVGSVTEDYLMDNDLPSIGSATTVTVNENTSVIYTATATDPTSAKVTFTLKDTGDASQLNIDSATGQVTLKSGAAPDHESGKTSYSFTVVAKDAAGNATEQAVTLGVTNVNDNAVVFASDANAASNSVQENATSGTDVGVTASASDADAGATVTYSLVTSDGSAYTADEFVINATSGVVTVGSGKIDYEAGATRTLYVKATASDNSSAVQQYTVDVTNVNDNAVVFAADANAASNSVQENATVGAVVGVTASASDADAGATVTYSLVTSDGSAYTADEFVINATSGVVTVGSGKIDYEAGATRTLYVKATSSDNSSAVQQYTVDVTNVNDNAVVFASDANAASNSVQENATVGADVGVTASASDADAGATVTYSLVTSDGSAYTADEFVINATSGVVTVGSGKIDYEAGATRTLYVKATSSDNSSAVQQYTVDVTNVNDNAVVFASDANAASNSVQENATSGTDVGVTASASDADAGATVTYSLVTSDGSAYTADEFVINATSGVVTVGSGKIDYEAGATRTLYVKATASDNSSAVQQYTVDVTNVNDNAVVFAADANAASNSVQENATVGAVVGVTASASDADAGATVTYSLVTSDGSAYTADEFVINATSGVVTVGSGKIDYEAGATRTLYVKATSSDNSSAVQQYTVDVTNVNDNAVVFASDANAASNSVQENATSGTDVGVTASASDADAGATVTYSLVTSDGSAYTADEFVINATSGVVTVGSGKIDYEAGATRTLYVKATASDNSSAVQQYTVDVTNVNDNAVVFAADANAASNSVQENATVGAVVGVTASASDADAGATVTYSLVTSDGSAYTADEFVINATSGVVTVGSGKIDYEAGATRTLYVKATSSDNSSAVQQYTVDVTNVNDTAPVITTSDAALKIGDTATVTFTFAQSTTGFDLSQIQSGSGSWVNGSLTAVAGSNNQVWTAQFTPNANVANASAAFKYHPTVPVAQVDTVTLAGTPEIGDSYQVTINGTTYSQSVTSSVSTLADVKAGLISKINAETGGAVTAAAGEGNTLVLTAKAAGVSFAASSAASNHVIDATEDATVSVTTANVAAVTAVTEVAAVAAVPAVSQVSTVSLSVLNGGVVTGADSVTVTIAGKAYKVDGNPTSVNTVAKLAEAVHAAITADASAAVTSTYVTGATSVTLTAKSANPTFTLAVTDNVENSVVSSVTTTEGSAAVAAVVGVPGVTGVAAVAQVDTVTLAGTPEIGDSYQVTINGTTYSQAVTSSVSTLADVKAALVNTINAATGIAVTAAEGANNTLVLTAKTAGNAFTASATATDRAAVDDQVATLANTTANVAFNGVTDHAGNRGLTDGEATSYTVDTVAPTVTSFSTDHGNGAVKAGEVIQITATTSEEMGAGSKVIATLSTGATVELVATNAGTTLTGSYTVGATDTSSDLTVSSYALANGAGAPVDAAGNAMTSTAVPSGVNNIGGANEIVIDTTAPTVLNFSTSTSDGIYKAGSTVTITATASETLAAGSKVTVGLSGGGSVELTADSAGNTLTGTYTVQAGQNSSDLTVIGYQLGASGLNVPVDMAGNAMSATIVPATPNNLGDVASIVVDTQAPTVTGFATSHADGSFKAGEIIAISATSSEPLVAGSTITATLSSGATVDLVAANNGTTLTGNYTVTAGQNTSDLTVSSYALASGNAAPKDAAGNAMTSTAVPTGGNNLADTKAIVVDTLTPDATLTANTAVMKDGRVDAAEMQSGVASVTAETGALLSVTFTGTAGSITRSLGTATGSAQTISLNAGDDVTLGQGAVSVSVTATDAASNTTMKSGANFSLHTETITTGANGTVSIGQLSVNGASTGSVINPFDGSVLGGGDKLDLTGINGKVVVDNVAGQVFANVGGKQLSSLIGIANTSDVIAGFDVITTGAGDDRIIGNDGLSEVFYAGAGRNQINGGDSSGTVDYVDYRGYAKPAQATVGGATTANTRTLTLTTNNVALGDVYSLKSGSKSVSVTATADMIATPALLVSALAAQLSQYTASGQSLNGLQITSSGNVITFTAGGDFDAAELNALLSAATAALTPETGVTVDLSTVVDLSSDLNAWGTSAYMAVRSDGSVDELTSIEGVLGTAYDDIIIGSDGDNVFMGDAGDDVIRGNGGNDVLIGGAGDDEIFGGVGNDRIIGGAGRDKIYGGTGKDTIVIGLDSNTTSDSIRDFDVSTILTGSAGRSGQALDKIDFNFTNAELAAKLAADGYTSVPATLNYKVALADYTGSVTPAQASAATPYSRVLELSVEASPGVWVKISEVRMDWESNPFGTLNPDQYILSAIKVADSLTQASDPALLNTFDTTSTSNHKLFAAVQFQRVGEIIDTTAAEAIVGARTGDFFVMSGGDDVLVGGLGSDRYEARILGSSDNVLPTAANQAGANFNGHVVVNDLGRAGGGLEQDAVFIEGARLGDLQFTRTQIAGEQAGRSLNIAYEQYRGVDDPTTAQNEVGMHHAHGEIDIFNQFSLTQGDLYAVEKIQLAQEVENPLAAAVQTYYLGKVTGATSAVTGAAAGDVIHAGADQDSLLIGTAGHHDTFVIDKPTSKSAFDSVNNVAADSQDVWIYGMDGAADDVVVKVGSGATSHAHNDASTLTSLNTNGFTMTDFNENGVQGKKATVVLNGTTTGAADDVTLNIFFADAGNVDSTTLLNRIKWES